MRILFVAWTLRGEAIRPITAYDAGPALAADYLAHPEAPSLDRFRQRLYDSNVLHELRRQIVPGLEVSRAVVRNPDFAVAILPNPPTPIAGR
jgi:hypothetical protein